MTGFVSSLKDRAILLGWVAGLILAAALLWSLTFHSRAFRLMRSTNQSFIETKDSRRLLSPVSRPFNGHFPLGCWYTLSGSDSLFFVFTVMKDGILVPYGAEISNDGKVTDIVPLGNHARQIVDRIPEGMVHVYLRRIESAASQAASRTAKRTAASRTAGRTSASDRGVR